jgi:hypothetical protein
LQNPKELYHVRLIAYKSRTTPPRFCLAPKPPLPLLTYGVHTGSLLTSPSL